MIQRSFRYYYLKVTRQRGTPENIAFGMAIGVFWGLFIPFPQMPMALLTATFTKANRITALLGTWISNPFTFPLLITFYIFAGQYLTQLKLNIRLERLEDDRYVIEVPVYDPQPRFRRRNKTDTEPVQPVSSSDSSAVVPADAPTKTKWRQIELRSGDFAIFIFTQGGKILVVWFSASTLCALLGAFITYHLTRVLVEGFRRRKLARLKRKRLLLERKAAEEEAIRGIHMGLDDQ